MAEIAMPGYRRDLPVTGLARASQVESDYQKFLRLQTQIEDDGTFHGMTAGYHFLKGCERTLGLRESAPEHPVDRVTGWILGSKWYWGAMLLLACAPAIPIIREEAKLLEEEVRGLAAGVR